ncbi:hypothetical protein DL96DRAFT_1817190 [Flagelloscypha sp. PMI_526]|nr:hypothetical protein DL96DRAFT_1817190 [Flagelloscypha sp. PMI_526]
MPSASTKKKKGFSRFTELPLELQGKIWQLVAWSATKSKQASLCRISKTAKHCMGDIRIEEVLYHAVYVAIDRFEDLPDILREDVPSAAKFREKTRSLCLVVIWEPNVISLILQQLTGITKLFLLSTYAQTMEVFQCAASLKHLREIWLPWKDYYVELKTFDQNWVSSTITHLIVESYVPTEAPNPFFWALFPNLTHLAIKTDVFPVEADFEALCQRSPENLVLLENGFLLLMGPFLKKRFSRKPIVLRMTYQRPWNTKRFWENTGKMWDAVNCAVREAKARDDDGYFIEVSEW